MIGWADIHGAPGAVIDVIGYAVDIVKLIESGKQWTDLQKSDFRDVITNENDYTFQMVDINAGDQISKYGNLLKTLLQHCKLLIRQTVCFI